MKSHKLIFAFLIILLSFITTNTGYSQNKINLNLCQKYLSIEFHLNQSKLNNNLLHWAKPLSEEKTNTEIPKKAQKHQLKEPSTKPPKTENSLPESKKITDSQKTFSMNSHDYYIGIVWREFRPPNERVLDWYFDEEYKVWWRYLKNNERAHDVPVITVQMLLEPVLPSIICNT